MKVTKILSGEHRVIEVVLTCLERMVQTALDAGQLDRQAADKAVEFLMVFADKCHHGKEETHLFRAMADNGMPAEGGPLQQMVYEHEQGRALVRAISEQIPGSADGDRTALGEFAFNARNYIDLLRAHIRKEDGILFPVADRTLSDEDQDRLLRAFELTESNDMGEGTHEKYLGIARDLAHKYNVSTKAIPVGSSCCDHSET